MFSFILFLGLFLFTKIFSTSWTNILWSQICKALELVFQILLTFNCTSRKTNRWKSRWFIFNIYGIGELEKALGWFGCASTKMHFILAQRKLSLVLHLSLEKFFKEATSNIVFRPSTIKKRCKWSAENKITCCL